MSLEKLTSQNGNKVSNKRRKVGKSTRQKTVDTCFPDEPAASDVFVGAPPSKKQLTPIFLMTVDAGLILRVRKWAAFNPLAQIKH